jgi:hypothetical protein
MSWQDDIGGFVEDIEQNLASEEGKFVISLRTLWVV